MLKGEAFSDVYTTFVGRRDDITTLGTYNLQRNGLGTVVTDISIGDNSFNGFRIDFIVGSLTGCNNDAEINLVLRHSDTDPPTDTLSAVDIVGPINENRDSIIGPLGQFKTLTTYDGVNLEDMGERTYGVGYIGNKNYLRAEISISGNNLGIVASIWCTLTATFVHAGKGSRRYLLRGAEGGY
jgi:hypothetical protein